ncbi:MAG: hypothetical protein IKB64_10070 [Paludibacteraceae bacterium]|nr:hypothetical protein [Paludibacteraceae bacterium]
MSNIKLTQTDLNEQLRGMTTADIMMFLPDKNISFPSNAVTSNKQTLRFTTNLQTLLEFASLPVANIATFENNSWILDGSFISPSDAFGGGGDSYSGYISNEMTDDDGNYPLKNPPVEETPEEGSETTEEEVAVVSDTDVVDNETTTEGDTTEGETPEGGETTDPEEPVEPEEPEILPEYDNPILTVTLSAVAPIVEYLSIQFAGGIDTSYPKVFKIRTFDKDSVLINEHIYDMTVQPGLPLMVVPINDENVKKVEFEFVGTVCPHRRSRLSKILFGKAEVVDPAMLKSWKIDDKVSLVADSIPTKQLTYEVINYQGDYDIDNPGNKVPINYKDAFILFTFGMEKNGLWKYTPTKIFNLIDISTTSDGLVTFTGGSLLDTLTETYDHDTYTGKRTIADVIAKLLAFSGVGTDQCELNEFGSYQINIPLPEVPVRELIQRLAFSCGATITINDENRIVFSKKNIIPTASTPKLMFHQPEPFNSAAVLLEEPKAEALANTTNIGMYTYDSKIDSDVTELGSSNVSTINPTRISFSATSGSAQFDAQELEDQSARIMSISEVYSQHAIITVTWTDRATPPIKVTALGRKVVTTKTMPKTADMDTLLLDSGLALTVPENMIRPANPNPNTFYYTDWYGAKFKYICKTRNEYLIKAGDIIYFETPFSDGQPIRVGYVLRNSYSNDEDSGEMEVITIGNN